MKRPRVALFVTCLADQIYPEVGLATLRLLERLGCRVPRGRGSNGGRVCGPAGGRLRRDRERCLRIRRNM